MIFLPDRGVEGTRVLFHRAKKPKRDGQRSASAVLRVCLDGLANANATKNYREMVSDLGERIMKPVVCLNHFTLPVWIQGGKLGSINRRKKWPVDWS